MPVLNYTELNDTLTEIERNGFRGKKEDIKARFFPRWSALSKIVNQKTRKQTSAIMVAGDSVLENQIGVSIGFPKIDLEQDEMIMLADVAEVLDLNNGDSVEVQYDLFQAAVSDLAKFKNILFNFQEYSKLNRDFDTQSQAFLKMFGISKT